MNGCSRIRVAGFPWSRIAGVREIRLFEDSHVVRIPRHQGGQLQIGNSLSLSVYRAFLSTHIL